MPGILCNSIVDSSIRTKLSCKIIKFSTPVFWSANCPPNQIKKHYDQNKFQIKLNIWRFPLELEVYF